MDEGKVELDGEDVTFLPEHRRARYIGHLFQDPMRGTAPNMTIEENLAVAYLHTAAHKNAFFEPSRPRRTRNSSAPSLLSSTWGWRIE